MKPKFALFNVFAACAVLFSVVFQSAHSVEHLAAEFHAKQCHHRPTQGKHELTHQHHKDDSCFVCHFSFSGFIGSDIYQFRYKKPVFHNAYSYSRSREITSFFRGSLFSHRGPPSVIA